MYLVAHLGQKVFYMDFSLYREKFVKKNLSQEAILVSITTHTLEK
jgi:hypothetical protein